MKNINSAKPRWYLIRAAYRYHLAVTDRCVHKTLKISALIKRMERLSWSGKNRRYSEGLPIKARHYRKWMRYGNQVLKMCNVKLILS